ncbi:MAG: hypothetical protein ABIR66_00735 [Saprospiraceae bacterium]
MNYIQIILLLILLLPLSQCTTKYKLDKSVTALQAQLLELHDSTMIQYGVALNLIEQLKKIDADSITITPIDSIRTELDGSNVYMTDWMADYQQPETKDSAAWIYLTNQIELLKKLALHQNQNINQGNILLRQNSKK